MCVYILTPGLYISSIPQVSCSAAQSYYAKLWISMLKGGGWMSDPWQRCLFYIGLISAALSQVRANPMRRQFHGLAINVWRLNATKVHVRTIMQTEI